MVRLIGFAAALWASAARAQTPDESDVVRIPSCDARDAMAAHLSGFHEQQLGWRLVGPSTLYELWGSEAGTWTLLAPGPGGVRCIVTVGEGARLRWHRA